MYVLIAATADCEAASRWSCQQQTLYLSNAIEVRVTHIEIFFMFLLFKTRLVQ